MIFPVSTLIHRNPPTSALDWHSRTLVLILFCLQLLAVFIFMVINAMHYVSVAVG